MTVGSPFFILFVLFSVVLWHGLPKISQSSKLIVINFVFIVSLFNSISSATALIIFLVIGYLALIIAARQISLWLFLGLLILVVLGFGVLKKYTFFEQLSPFQFYTSTIGLSYILFRVVHLMVDLNQGAIKKPPSVKGYLNYLLFFLSFESGPIARYQNYCEQMSYAKQQLAEKQIESKLAFSRIIIGTIKVLVIASIANRVTTDLSLDLNMQSERTLGVFAVLPDWLLTCFPVDAAGQPLIRTSIRYGVRATAFLFYLYYSFSGYMDIICGAGRLLGVSISENFRSPFSARNFLEFWSKWHITLSDWFKIYLFNPLLKLMIKKFGPNFANGWAVIAFFITFLIMGVWHGTSLAFLIYGIFLGLGVSMNKLFQVFMHHLIGKQQYINLSSKAIYYRFSQSLFISYFILSLTCLWLDSEELAAIAELFGVSGVIFVYFLLSIFILVILFFWELSIKLVKCNTIPKHDFLLIIGMISICVLWGNVNGLTHYLSYISGIGLPESMVSVAGGLLILFGMNSGDFYKVGNNIVSSTYVQSTLIATILLASILGTGEVPDFIYKGF